MTLKEEFEKETGCVEPIASEDREGYDFWIIKYSLWLENKIKNLDKQSKHQDSLLSDFCVVVYLEFPDGDTRRLPDISFEKWEDLLWKEGANDSGYQRYLSDNNMHEVQDFNESIFEAELVFKTEIKELRFKCVYHSEYEKTKGETI